MNASGALPTLTVASLVAVLLLPFWALPAANAEGCPCGCGGSPCRCRHDGADAASAIEGISCVLSPAPGDDSSLTPPRMRAATTPLLLTAMLPLPGPPVGEPPPAAVIEVVSVPETPPPRARR